MTIEYVNRTYRITYGGVALVENALEDPRLIQISVASGTRIMLAPMKGYGIDYLPNGEYRSWTLTGYNTRLNKIEKHFIYARLDRDSDSAMILFSVNDYAFDGSYSGGEKSEDYYYVKIGSISETDTVPLPDMKKREITFDYGYLATPADIDSGKDNWKKLFEVTADDLIRPLKRFASFVVQGSLRIIGKIVLNDKVISDVTRQGDEIINEKNDEAVPTTAYLSGKFTEELRKVFLNKDREDQTAFLLSFLGGAEFGDFFDSMLAGRGAGIFPDGRGQFERLEVRGSLSVLDLIINQIQGMESDYSFTEIGRIGSVEDLGENTYKLAIEKRTEFDFMKFKENDVCFSIVNTLLTGGSEYYTSWMRVISSNSSDNSITVVLYPNAEVPGGTNFPPLAGYNVTRRGNSVIPGKGAINERAQSWMLSSREGRLMFLSNVYKPILEDYNYALTIGLLPNIKALEKLPVTTKDVGIVAQTVIAEKFYQFDYNGDVVPNKVDRGTWSLTTAQGGAPYRFMQHELQKPSGNEYTLLEQHTVYHLGCKWGCLEDKTTAEPKWNSPSWELLEGDSRYSLELSLSGGEAFLLGEVDTVISGRIFFGSTDITDEVMAEDAADVEWLRDSGNTPADNAWTPDFIPGKQLAIHVDNSNQHGVGSDFGFGSRSISFICRVFIPVGGSIQKVEQRLGFDIL